jgi:hypothetical protein
MFRNTISSVKPSLPGKIKARLDISKAYQSLIKGISKDCHIVNQSPPDLQLVQSIGWTSRSRRAATQCRKGQHYSNNITI